MRQRAKSWLGIVTGVVFAGGVDLYGQNLLNPLPSPSAPNQNVPTPLAPPSPPTIRPLPTRPTSRTTIPARPTQVTIGQPVQTTATASQENVFGWDALQKEVNTKPGETNVLFTFALTNISQQTVTINGVHTSCGCTVAKLPQIPWTFAPGDNGTFEVSLDVRNKVGVVTKTVTVNSTAGFRYLTVRASIPVTQHTAMSQGERVRNLQIALADRQAVFQGSCVTCHVTPGVGKRGKELFHGVCGVCHDAEHRASMVPDLRKLNKPQDVNYWRNWITNGKDGTLMPAWGQANGGPLTTAEIDSLVEYLTGPFKKEPAPGRRLVVPALPTE